MQNDIASQLIDDDGQLKSFDKWLQDIKGMTTHYVGPWLRTEYNTAVLRAHQAADWKHFEQEQDVFQNLRWMPTTSPEQDPLHRQYWEKKLTLPINHPFWEKHRPGDRWNCKCSLAQTDEPANDEVIRDFYPVPQQPGLDNNPADDGKLFSDTHPYITKAYAGARKAVIKKRFQKTESQKTKHIKRQKTEEEKTIIKTRWDARQARRANIAEAAKRLEMPVPTATMTFEAANKKRGNPLFDRNGDEKWRQNCQCCVVTNELRRRGFKVKAVPNTWITGSIPSQLGKTPQNAWIDPTTGKAPSVTKCGGAKAYVNARGSVVRRGATLKELTADLNKATAEVGRYHMGYAWQKGGKHGAHIITVEKLPDGSLRIYDPQSGDILKWKDIATTLNMTQPVIVYRVDNLYINTDIIDQIVVPAAE